MFATPSGVRTLLGASRGSADVSSRAPGAPGAASAPGAVLYSPDGQLEVRVQLAGQTLSGREVTLLRLAPTASLLDALGGDVHGALPAANVGARVRAGDELVSLRWEGVLMSDADELYHSRFEAASGAFAVRAPVDGTVLAYNDRVLAGTAASGGAEPLDVRAGTWLVQLEAADPSALLGLLEAELPARPRE